MKLENHNHVQTIHAGAQFTLAESTAAAATMGTFPDLFQSATLLVTKSSVEYKAPAAGTIEAKGTRIYVSNQDKNNSL